MTITLERARELLKKAVETQGRDFVYNPDGLNICYYNPRPEEVDGPQALTGCLVGTALTLAGEDRHLWHGGTVSALSDTYPDMMRPEAAAYFRAAQRLQDGGWTWGEAFGYAEKSLAESDED